MKKEDKYPGNNDFNLLICGSQKFDDNSFVFGTLDAFYTNFTVGNGIQIDNIITSRFSGPCEAAERWVGIINDRYGANIGHKVFSFDMDLEKKHTSLYAQSEIPEFIIKNDPFFQKGKDQLLESHIKMILAFPNKENKLGASTLNIQRFAKLAQLETLDCSALWNDILIQRELEMQAQASPIEQAYVGTLTNRHPGKKL